jgi:uroporphyrin-III C-methyltransferase/precorrin-2 dehydrogenase/sirohydrochlorin ferrochelatase
MRYFPTFLDLQGRRVLVVGGGETAARKVRLLLKARARVIVVAHSLCDELAGLAQAGEITYDGREFRAGDVLDCACVIAATGLEAVDEAVAETARVANIPVNAVDRPWASTFITPAIVDRDPIVIGISSAGASPVLARRIRARLEAMLPPNLGRLAGCAESFRAAVASRRTSETRRLRFWEWFFDSPVAEDVLAGREARARERMLSLVNRDDDDAEDGESGEVAIVGAGPGDPDLLTFKAMRFLQRADVIVYDRLVGDGIVDYARRDAERIYVGKTPGAKAATQAEINALLAEYALAGKRVVRLKGGDPFIFGRGGEEMEYLHARGIRAEIVPGITAATGCAAAAGIPLTHRDHAKAVTFVTGHAQDGADEPDWPALATPGQTLVIYMGVRTAGRIADRLIDHGLAGSTPASVIENGTKSTQRVVATSLERLESDIRAHGISAPALLVVGEVAAYASTTASAAEPARALAI